MKHKILIPARRDSKGIPRKNLLTINQKHLIEYTFEFAQSLNDIADIYLSTNDPDVIELSEKYPINVPFTRPENLSEDSTPMSSVISHFATSVSWEKKQFLILLDPTSPLRKRLHLEQAISNLEKSINYDGIISISKPFFNPIWVSVKKDKDSNIKKFFPEFETVSRRQDLPNLYRVNGNFYIWRNEFAKQISIDWLNKSKSLGFEIDELFALSIDTPSEVQLFKLLQKIF